MLLELQERTVFHKNPRVARREDRIEVKSMIDLVLVKKYMLCYMQDVRAVTEMGRVLSPYCTV